MKELIFETIAIISSIIALLFTIIGFNNPSFLEDNIVIVCLLIYGMIYNYLYREKLKK